MQRLAYLLSMFFLLGFSNPEKVLLTNLDGKAVQLNFKETKATVIFFLSPECPLCESYSLNIRKILDQYQIQMRLHINLGLKLKESHFINGKLMRLQHLTIVYLVLKKMIGQQGGIVFLVEGIRIWIGELYIHINQIVQVIL
jgi:hypothetical protein